MRRLLLTFCLLLLAGCQPKPVDDEYAANFVPPTLLKRGDYETALEARWIRLGRSVDGAIALADIPEKYHQRLGALDADHDGKISHREFIRGSLARFDHEDSNHDGMLTNVESTAARKAEKNANATTTPTATE